MKVAHVPQHSPMAGPRSAAAPAQPPPNPAPPEDQVDVGKSRAAKIHRVFSRTVVGALLGGAAGKVGGAGGGALGLGTGVWVGGNFGWGAGSRISLNLAQNAGEGKANPVAAGIGALTVPFLTTAAGAVAGGVALTMAAAQANPVLGAAIGGGTALIGELLKPY